MADLPISGVESIVPANSESVAAASEPPRRMEHDAAVLDATAIREHLRRFAVVTQGLLDDDLMAGAWS